MDGPLIQARVQGSLGCPHEPQPLACPPSPPPALPKLGELGMVALTLDRALKSESFQPPLFPSPELKSLDS